MSKNQFSIPSCSLFSCIALLWIRFHIWLAVHVLWLRQQEKAVLIWYQILYIDIDVLLRLVIHYFCSLTEEKDKAVHELSLLKALSAHLCLVSLLCFSVWGHFWTIFFCIDCPLWRFSTVCLRILDTLWQITLSSMELFLVLSIGHKKINNQETKFAI